MKQKILIAIGFIFLAFGAIGIVVPLWPTTPFVLVAAICFSKNKRLSSLLVKNRFFGPYILHYRNGTPVSKLVIVSSLIFLWVVLSISALSTNNPTVHIILLIAGVSVTIHLLFILKKSRLRTKKLLLDNVNKV